MCARGWLSWWGRDVVWGRAGPCLLASPPKVFKVQTRPMAFGFPQLAVLPGARARFEPEQGTQSQNCRIARVERHHLRPFLSTSLQ